MKLAPFSKMKVIQFSSLSVLAIAISLTSCSGKDSICDCISAGDQLNKKSNKALQHIPSKVEIAEIKRLQKEKAKKCKEFQTMSGKDMLERKATCE